MNQRELILLSPYRVPAKDSLMLGDDDMASFLNGYTALWHPALVVEAAGPPRIASPYDYESPTAGHVYALPESPQMFLPEDWEFRVREAGALSFRASPDRRETIANLNEALTHTAPDSSEASQQAIGDWRPEHLAPFFAIAFGHMHLLALFEAMDHENLLDAGGFWQELQQAAASIRSDHDSAKGHLQAAAEKLLSAREALYPTTIHIIDLAILDERVSADPFPAALLHGLNLNVIASGAALDGIATTTPELLAQLRKRVEVDQIEICTGSYRDREDALLPVESQIWNLCKGLETARNTTGSAVQTYARNRFAGHPQLQALLANVGVSRALLANFDDTSSSSHQNIVSHWTAPSGKQIDIFTRSPYRGDAPATFFHTAYYLHQTISKDFVATLALSHRGKKACAWYDDWVQLTRLAPVLGKWTTLSNYFNDVLSGEPVSTAQADEIQADYLTDRTEGHVGQPVSWFAQHARLRRRLDTAWTLAGIYRGLAGGADKLDVGARLATLEDQVELSPAGESAAIPATLDGLQAEVATALAKRLLARAANSTPGYLVVNPCSFTRRVAIEVDVSGVSLPIEGPLKASQVDNGRGKLVVEVPALGFAWVPRQGTGEPPPAKRFKLADERHVRNEFLEAEIDPMTGGLRGVWDPRTHVSRLGQMLVYNPGSTMRCKSVTVNSTGPALGEVVTEGAILDGQDQVLATFRQRFRAWLGRPVLELRVEIYPEQLPVGYPWHAYYGARFAWRDERTLLLRGVNGTGNITSHTRPETPDYLEWRLGRQSTTLFPGGLPFHQRHGARMLDVVLIPEGEDCKTFDLCIGLDRDYPMQTALGMITPVPIVPVEQGPPHVGSAGWLFHLDAANLLMTGMRPVAGADAVVARVVECALGTTQADLRCVRNPVRATLLDARGESLTEGRVVGDTVQFEVAASDCTQLRIDFQ